MLYFLAAFLYAFIMNSNFGNGYFKFVELYDENVINNPMQVIKNQWSTISDGTYVANMVAGSRCCAVLYRIGNGSYGAAIIFGYPYESIKCIRINNGVWEGEQSLITNSDLAATKMSIVQTTDEASIDNAYNNWSSSISNATYYKGAILHNIVHSVLGGGTWLLEGYKHDSAYEWQEIRSYDNDGIKNYCRSKMAGTWKPWVAK